MDIPGAFDGATESALHEADLIGGTLGLQLAADVLAGDPLTIRHLLEEAAFHEDQEEQQYHFEAASRAWIDTL